MQEGRYGVIISQQGIPVDRANDYQKVLDSRWKFLDIAYERMIDITIPPSAFVGSNGNRKILLQDHNLPYIPAFEFLPSSVSGGLDDAPFDLAPVDVAKGMRSNQTGIYLTFTYISGGADLPIRVKGMLRVYALDIMQSYKAPSQVLGVAKPQPKPRNGAKFLDQTRGGKSINDGDPYAYTMNTDFKQQAIHLSGPYVATSTTLTVQHDVGYPPTYMLCLIDIPITAGFFAPAFTTTTAGPLFESSARAEADAVNIVFRGVQTALAGRTFGCIILKDPAEVAG